MQVRHLSRDRGPGALDGGSLVECGEVGRAAFLGSLLKKLPEDRHRSPFVFAMLFSHLRVWDTDDNCGVLLYVLLAEHRIEIIADRGIAKVVTPAEWEAITAHMRDEFAQGHYREAVQTGVAEAGALLARHFPGNGSPRENQLPDRPLVL